MSNFTLPAQQMPLSDTGGRATQPWYQFFANLFGAGSPAGTLLVNPGTGNQSRTINAALADYANVNDYLNVGDTNYDGAISRCLAARGRAYFPSKPALGGSVYKTTVTIALANGQALRGDGFGISVIQCQTAAVPVVTLGTQIYFFEIAGLSLTHRTWAATGATHSNTTVDSLSVNPVTLGWAVGMGISGSGIPVGTTLASVGASSVTLSQAATSTGTGVALTVTGAASGGHGIHAGQGLTDWVNDGLIENVECVSNWIGFNLGKCFFANIRNSTALGNVNKGWSFTSTGASTVPAGAAGGPLQWYLHGCRSDGNGDDGFAYTSTASTTTTISVGALNNCTTYNNGGYGVAAYGNSNAGIYSVRLIGGFYGNDQKHEVYLDSYGNRHVIAPDMIELAGQGWAVNAGNPACGVYTTINGASGSQNTDTMVRVGQINGCTGDGVFIQAPDCQVLGGIITNNGIGAVAGRQNGVYFFGVTGMVAGVIAKDTGQGSQKYGVTCNVAGMQLTGCTLVGNITAPTSLPTFVGDTTTTIVGCLPLNINQVYADQLHVYGAAAFLGAGGTAGTLGITVSAGGANFTTGVANNGITVDNITVNTSLGVGYAASGTAGLLKVGDLYVNRSMGLAAAPDNTSAHIVGPGGGIAFAGGLNVNITGALAVTGATTLTGGATLGSDISLGGHNLTNAGTITASSTLTGGSLSLSGAISGATTINASSTITGGSLALSGAITGATNITASTDITSNGTLHISGASSMSGGLTLNSGASITGTSGSGLTIDNIKANVSLGVGTGASGVSGQIDLTSAIKLNGVAYTNP